MKWNIRGPIANNNAYNERFTMKNPLHRPRNRTATALEMLDNQVEHRTGVVTMTPNDIAVMAATGQYPVWEPIDNLVSEMSGEPAFIVRVDDLEMAFSFAEMDRFFRRDLLPEEYSYLVKKFGMFYDIHDDFYTDQGEAIQPIEQPKVTKTKLRKIQKTGM